MSMKEIGSSAFRNCWSLDDVTLPKGIKLADNTFKSTNPHITYVDPTEAQQ